MRILVVEDNKVVAAILQKILTSLHHEVTICPDGETALVACARDDFPVIVVDIMLPGVSGLEICRRIRAGRHDELPHIIVETAKQTPEDFQNILAAGANDYFPKPIDPDLIKVRIAQAEQRVRGLERQRAAYRSLLESETKIRALLQHCPALLWQTNEHGQCVFWNEALYEFLGHRPEHEVTAQWYGQLAPDDRARVEKNHREALLQQAPCVVRYARPHADGRVRQLIERGTPRYSEEKRFIGYSFAVLDVSECAELHP